MMDSEIAIVSTGTANLASVSAAFERIGYDPRIVDVPSDVRSGDRLVLPGVGSFATGMNAITANRWADYLQERYAADQATLSICLGMQMLGQGSEEAVNINGVGILPVHATRFPDQVTTPQLGWNRVTSVGELLEDGFAYFANSYSFKDVTTLTRAGWNVSTAEHGVEFVAAIQKGQWLACQFHPELSGKFGLRLLQKWIGRCDADVDGSQKRGATC